MSFIVVVVPGRRRRVQVFQAVNPDHHWRLYTVIQENTSDDTRVTVARCDREHLGAWLLNNVEPTLFEKLIGRIRYSLSSMVAP